MMSENIEVIVEMLNAWVPAPVGPPLLPGLPAVVVGDVPEGVTDGAELLGNSKPKD